MGVIPRCAVHIRKERIGHACSRGNRALFNCRNAVVPWSTLLQNTMPMQSSAIFRARDFVTYVDGDSVAPISFNGWTRELPVYQKDAPVYSIGRFEATSDVEIVCGTLAACRDCQHLGYSSREVILLTTIEVFGVGIVVADCISSPGNDTIHPSE